MLIGIIVLVVAIIVIQAFGGPIFLSGVIFVVRRIKYDDDGLSLCIRNSLLGALCM